MRETQKSPGTVRVYCTKRVSVRSLKELGCQIYAGYCVSYCHVNGRKTNTFTSLRSWGRNKAIVAGAQKPLKLEW